MALVFSLIYAHLGTALKLVMALCRQSGPQSVYKIRLCPAVGIHCAAPLNREIASPFSQKCRDPGILT